MYNDIHMIHSKINMLQTYDEIIGNFVYLSHYFTNMWRMNIEVPFSKSIISKPAIFV